MIEAKGMVRFWFMFRISGGARVFFEVGVTCIITALQTLNRIKFGMAGLYR